MKKKNRVKRKAEEEKKTISMGEREKEEKE